MNLVFLPKRAGRISPVLFNEEPVELSPGLFAVTICDTDIVFTLRGERIDVLTAGGVPLKVLETFRIEGEEYSAVGKALSKEDYAHWQFVFQAAPEYQNVWELRFGQFTTAWGLHFRFFSALETAIKIRDTNYNEKLNSWCEQFIRENTPA